MFISGSMRPRTQLNNSSVNGKKHATSKLKKNRKGATGCPRKSSVRKKTGGKEGGRRSANVIGVHHPICTKNEKVP